MLTTMMTRNPRKISTSGEFPKRSNRVIIPILTSNQTRSEYYSQSSYFAVNAWLVLMGNFVFFLVSHWWNIVIKFSHGLILKSFLEVRGRLFGGRCLLGEIWLLQLPDEMCCQSCRALQHWVIIDMKLIPFLSPPLSALDRLRRRRKRRNYPRRNSRKKWWRWRSFGRTIPSFCETSSPTWKANTRRSLTNASSGNSSTETRKNATNCRISSLPSICPLLTTSTTTKNFDHCWSLFLRFEYDNIINHWSISQRLSSSTFCMYPLENWFFSSSLTPQHNHAITITIHSSISSPASHSLVTTCVFPNAI